MSETDTEFVPAETAEQYADAIKAADTSTEFDSGADRTERKPEPEPPAGVQNAVQEAAAGGDEFFEIGGRRFPLNADGVREAATAWNEAQRYISQTRRVDDDDEDEYEEEYEEEPQPQVRMGDPQTVEEAYALADSEDLKDRRRGFDWALRNRDNLIRQGMEDVYDYAINGLHVANPSLAQRLLADEQMGRVRQAQAEAMQPQIDAQAHRATITGLDHFKTAVGPDEAQTWAPALMNLVAQGAILRDPNTVFDGEAVGRELVTVYQTMKGQQLMDQLRAGQLTPEDYQAQSLQLAIGQAPAAAPTQNGHVVRHAPQASAAHTTQLAGDRSGPQGTPAPNDYAARYRAAIKQADRQGY